MGKRARIAGYYLLAFGLLLIAYCLWTGSGGVGYSLSGGPESWGYSRSLGPMSTKSTTYSAESPPRVRKHTWSLWGILLVCCGVGILTGEKFERRCAVAFCVLAVLASATFLFLGLQSQAGLHESVHWVGVTLYGHLFKSDHPSFFVVLAVVGLAYGVPLWLLWDRRAKTGTTAAGATPPAPGDDRKPEPAL